MTNYVGAYQVGRWLIAKARRQQVMAGTFAAARNLRKQGTPLALSLLILTGRTSA